MRKKFLYITIILLVIILYLLMINTTHNASDKALAISCGNNMKLLQQALLTYIHNYHSIPPKKNVTNYINQFVIDKDIWHCPIKRKYNSESLKNEIQIYSDYDFVYDENDWSNPDKIWIIDKKTNHQKARDRIISNSVQAIRSDGIIIQNYTCPDSAFDGVKKVESPCP